MTIYVIEDEKHAEWCGKFPSFNDALEEQKKRATIPWHEKPNVCPCTNWKHCGRNYEIVEFDTTKKPWRENSRVPVLEVSANGVVWNEDYQLLSS